MGRLTVIDHLNFGNANGWHSRWIYASGMNHERGVDTLKAPARAISSLPPPRSSAGVPSIFTRPGSD